MSSSEGGGYRLAPRALDDLEEVWRFSAESWSIEQADRYIDALAQVFEALATMPNLAREYREFNPPVRIFAHESHVIIYKAEATHVVVLRVLGGRQDWLSILKAADL